MSHDAHAGDHAHAHVMSVPTHWAVFGALLALLVITIAIAFVNLGALGVAVAMTIATIKAVLIILYFMHVKFSSKLIWIFSSAAFYWLLILLALTFNDYFTRPWLDVLGK